MRSVKQIYPLTSLRFFAALCVVFHHTLDSILPALRAPDWRGRLQEYSGATVLLFFILSGYVLAVAYLEQGRPIDKKRFWTARFARIYPLYFVALLLDAPNLFHYRLVKYGTKAALLKTSISLLGSTFFLQDWFRRLEGIDFPNWSLCVEALFYLLFPIFGARFWRLSLTTQWICAVSMFFGFFGLQHMSFLSGVNLFDYMPPVPFLPYFVCGIALYSLKLRMARNSALLREWQKASPWLALLTVIALAVACAVPRRLDVSVVPGLLFLPGFSLLLLCFSVGNRYIDAFFSRPILVLLGEASYSLYLLHIIVWRWLFGYLHLTLNIATYLFYIAAAILLSIASFRYLEVPARRYILRAQQLRNPEPEPIAALAQ